ncbi:hypothetical protein PtrM4_104830 [Pyrenophora tritici-repentis]|uniref:Pogo transposable element n=1 Tax=Pyrenophora tritici-repentis TaxID=45151 RepID=A0A834RV99_9PLEO|nr:hypothetical protein PtrM4_104830 [Pyrenophora tritici-repentis]KAI1514530.1 Pogo transposable element [Pyrenophora tritici-repentis]
MFSPLAAAYSAALTDHLTRSQGIWSITKRDFFSLFSTAWSTSFTAKNVLAAFKATGIAPLDPQVILQRFASKKDSRPSSSELNKAAVQHQKSEAVKLRKEQKLLKQIALEERRHLRLTAKQQRDRLKAAEAAAREEQKIAKQAQKQIQNDVQLSRRWKRQSIKAQTKAKINTVVGVDNRASTIASATSIVTTRRGRNVKLPAKFK